MSSDPVTVWLYVGLCFCVCVSWVGTFFVASQLHVQRAVEISIEQYKISGRPENGWLWSALACGSTDRLAYDWQTDRQTNRLTDWLTPRSRDFLQQLPVSKLSKKLPALCGTRRFNTVLTTGRQWLRLEIESLQIKLLYCPFTCWKYPLTSETTSRWSVTNPSPLKDRTSNMLKWITYLSDVILIANVHSRDINAFIKVSNCEHCSLAFRSCVVPTATPAPLSSLFTCRLLFRTVSFKIRTFSP